MLLALKLFSGQATDSVGAVCMSMCGSQDATCTGQPKPDGCTAGGPGIRNLKDFVAAVPGLLAGLASGAVQNGLTIDDRRSTGSREGLARTARARSPA